MTEEQVEYQTGPADAPEPPPLTTEALVALAHAHRQGIPYETGEQVLARLPGTVARPGRSHPGGKMNAGAYAVAALIDGIEPALGYRGRQLH